MTIAVPFNCLVVAFKRTRRYSETHDGMTSRWPWRPRCSGEKNRKRSPRLRDLERRSPRVLEIGSAIWTHSRRFVSKGTSHDTRNLSTCTNDRIVSLVIIWVTLYYTRRDYQFLVSFLQDDLLLLNFSVWNWTSDFYSNWIKLGSDTVSPKFLFRKFPLTIILEFFLTFTFSRPTSFLFVFVFPLIFLFLFFPFFRSYQLTLEVCAIPKLCYSRKNPGFLKIFGITKVSGFSRMFGIPENFKKPNARSFNIHFVQYHRSF